MYKSHLTLDDIYVSPLRPLGNGLYEVMNDADLLAVPSPKTQCLLMDELARALMRSRRFRVDEVSRLVGVPSKKLSVCISVMFGCNLNELIEAYQQRLLLELVRCTNLSPEDVARRAGYRSEKSMYNHFTRCVNDTFFAYRERHQRRVRTVDDRFELV
ncbi:MAG: hypothetical protein KBT20_05550 [Bacteroidales bacterium]|nr:hypothetical protein [Candidatus Liminaster caballi]